MKKTGTTIQASIWSVSGKLLSRFFDLGLLLVFSRILTPEDFGLVALAMVPIYVGIAIFSLPLMQTLIRVKNPSPILYDTAFTLSILRACVFGLVLIAISFPMANFYDDDRLIPLVCVLAIFPIFRGLVSPNLAKFLRVLDFRREFALDTIGKLFGFLTSISLAFATQSYWAIAAMPIVTGLTMFILSYILAPYRPRVTLAGWKEFADMIGWNTISQTLTATNAQLGRILLGRYIPTDTLGNYTISEDILSIPTKSIVQPLDRPLMASFSINSDPRHMVYSYQLFQSTVVSLLTPIFLAISILSVPMIYVVFGNQWADAGEILKWLSLTWIAPLSYAPLYALALSLDKTRYIALLSGFEFLIKIPAMIWGIQNFGIWGAIGALFIGGVITSIIAAFIAKKLINFSVWTQLISLIRPAISSVAMAICMIWLIRDMTLFLSLPRPQIVLFGVGIGTIGLILYIFSMFLLWRLMGRPNGFESKLVDKVREKFPNRFSS